MVNNSYNPVNTAVPDTGSPGNYLNVSSNPNQFGAQVGRAVQELGATGVKAGVDAINYEAKQNAIAVEARSNDRLGNQWMPEAARLRAEYDSLEGPDKIAGYNNYINSLNAAREKFLEGSTSEYERNLLSNSTSKQIQEQIIQGKREQTAALDKYTDSSNLPFLKAKAQYAAQNRNNPEIVSSTLEQMESMVQKHGMDRDLPQDEIDYQKSLVRGEASVEMVNHALASGDIEEANSIFYKNKSDIPGPQRISITKALNSESVRQTGERNAEAILSGKPIPRSIGAHPADVRASVAKAASNAGVDQNHALTVLRIESSDGQDVGKRGTIGQTKTGGTLEEQAAALALECNKAKDAANQALEREAEPWEQYVVYQQGVAGGPALLSAAETDPTARAVDVLNPLYKNPKDALNAVVKNGGNASMTSGQFLSFLKRKYEINYSRAACTLPIEQTPEIPNPEGGDTLLAKPPAPTLADSIIKSYENRGIAVQTGSNPEETLSNFDAIMSDAVSCANQIPNDEERKATLESLKDKREVFRVAASEYRINLQKEAEKIAEKPDFTSINQIPVELRTKLEDMPDTINYMKSRAKYNMKLASGVVDGDMKTYGRKFYDLFRAVHAPDGTPGAINSAGDLMKYVGQEDGLTISGYEKLSKEIQDGNTPESKSEGAMKKAFFDAAKGQISNQNDVYGMKDPNGEMLYAQFLTQALPLYEKGRSEGKSAVQLLSENSPDYIGKIIPSFKRTNNQMMVDTVLNDGENSEAPNEKDGKSIISDILWSFAPTLRPVESQRVQNNEEKSNSLKQLITQARSENDPVKKKELEEKARKLWIDYKSSMRTVPIAED